MDEIEVAPAGRRRLSPDGIYLALGGGAARGFAHLGILRALEAGGVPIAGICGTSMGALVGANYALVPNADQVIQDFKNYLHGEHFDSVRYAFIEEVKRRGKRERWQSWKRTLRNGLLYGRSLTQGSIVSFDDFRREIYALLPDKAFRDTKIPFFAVGVDLTNYREVVFDRGLLRSAVLASCAIPGVFPAVRDGNTVFVDGGWLNKIPVNPLIAFGGSKVLAVDVSDTPKPQLNPRRGYSLVSEVNNAAQLRLIQLQTERAALFWRPPVDQINWADFTDIDRAVEVGRRFAEEHLHELQRLMVSDRKPSWWRRWGSRLMGEKKTAPVKFSFDVRGIWDIDAAGNAFNP